MILNRRLFGSTVAIACVSLGGCAEFVFNGPSPEQLKSDLGVVALQYLIYQTSHGASPTSWEQLESACVEEGGKTAIRTIRDAGYSFKWGVKVPGLGKAEEVFAEKPGGGPVLMGDGSTEWARP